jgi:hypothetical protein
MTDDKQPTVVSIIIDEEINAGKIISADIKGPAIVTSLSVNETIPFRRFHMPCCDYDLCWMTRKYPIHCPNCGQHCYMRLKHDEFTTDKDDSAWIKYCSKKL